MEWTADQSRAIRGALDYVATYQWGASNPWYIVAGFAGSGKTQVLAEIRNQLAGDVAVLTPTGKAAYVLRQRGIAADTLHSRAYRHVPKSAMALEIERHKLRAAELDREEMGKGREFPRPERVKLGKKIHILEQDMKRPAFHLNMESSLCDVKAIMLDEASMFDGRIVDDICWFKKPLIVFLDPGQLPPVKSVGFFDRQKPDVFLREIHRQAKESPIIRLSMMARDGKFIRLGDYGDGVKVVDRISREEALQADQVLVGRNATRREKNRIHQKLHGLGDDGLPRTGAKLVCLRNDHDVGVLNGSLWRCLSVDELDGSTGPYILGLESIDTPGEVITVDAWRECFTGEEFPWAIRRDAQEFDLGWAITVHKSQGSQWRNVVVIDESNDLPPGVPPDKWIYTATTRAQEKLTIVRKWA